MSINQTLYIPLFAGAILFFLVSCYRRLRLIALGAAENRFERPVARLAGMLGYAFGQKRVVQRAFGLNHVLLFWAFLLLALANAEFLLEGLSPAFSFSRLPAALHNPLALFFDVVSLIALASVAVALSRRLLFPPEYLGNDYSSPRSGEALLILGMIATLMLAFFVLHAARIALGVDHALRPVSAVVAGLLEGSSAAVLGQVATAAWWVHAIVLLLFLNLLPRSKHMHILTAIPNTYLRTLDRGNLLPRETFQRGGRFGASAVEDLSWKDLLDSLTCTECGRCQDLCPAYRTGKPLNPRKVVHDIKSNLLSRARKGAKPLPLVAKWAGEGTSSEEALWSCTTCGSCLQACPVLIEQMPKIIKMRRFLVEEETRFPVELLGFFENMEQRSNPWGLAPADRTKWASQLGDREFRTGESEYLFFVGCAGSFDTRGKQVSVALASILDAAKLSWGILGKEELCCGDSLRRLGNEYLFDRHARQNVERFTEKGVKRIVTACPHCFSTLKNDYRQYGLDIEVLHHTELIDHLISRGRLQLKGHAGQGRTLFHDSCYLGRHNNTYQAPRRILAAATGSTTGEFGRNRSEAFCCGAGGGRMWMEETLGRRINLERVKEAMEQKPDTICVSCPYCMTMIEDGLKDEQAAGVRVRDVAEVVAEALV